MAGDSGRRVGLAVLVSITAGLAAAVAQSGPMTELLQSHPGLRDVLRDPARTRLQAVLGRIEERPGERPVLVQHGYRLDEEYFYPASTVKLFAAVAALEHLDVLRRDTGLAVGPDSGLVFHPLFPGEIEESSDPSNASSGRLSVRHEIRKIFLVSDNQAFNHLFELVGPDRLAASLRRAGLPAVRILHRLSELRTPEENRRTPRIDLVGDGFTQILPARLAPPLEPGKPIAGLEVGRAFLTAEGRVERPMDFSSKNRASLTDLQRGLCMVVRPDVDCGGRGFDLTQRDRELLQEALHQLPRESANPLLDPAAFADSYVKFLLPGLRRVLASEHLRVFAKTGQAYGFTTENSYVVDQQSGRSFFLAATIYTNDNGVLNDDHYEYDRDALPFMANLGEAAARLFFAPSATEGEMP